MLCEGRQILFTWIPTVSQRNVGADVGKKVWETGRVRGREGDLLKSWLQMEL